MSEMKASVDVLGNIDLSIERDSRHTFKLLPSRFSSTAAWSNRFLKRGRCGRQGLDFLTTTQVENCIWFILTCVEYFMI